jgi:hypothetical protein
MTWLARYAVAGAAALAVMAGWSAWMKNAGVKSERARVETIGKKIDARAKVARKKVEAKKPDELQADLRKYCRDCSP